MFENIFSDSQCPSNNQISGCPFSILLWMPLTAQNNSIDSRFPLIRDRYDAGFPFMRWRIQLWLVWNYSLPFHTGLAIKLNKLIKNSEFRNNYLFISFMRCTKDELSFEYRMWWTDWPFFNTKAASLNALDTDFSSESWNLFRGQRIAKGINNDKVMVIVWLSTAHTQPPF